MCGVCGRKRGEFGFSYCTDVTIQCHSDFSELEASINRMGKKMKKRVPKKGCTKKSQDGQTKRRSWYQLDGIACETTTGSETGEKRRKNSGIGRDMWLGLTMLIVQW